MDIHISLAAEELFKVGPVSVTNSMMTMFLVMIVVLTVGTLIARRAQAVPTGKAQGLAELLIGFLVDLVEGTGGKRLGRRILPLISGIFIFILFSNFSGLLPGVGTIGVMHEEEYEEEEHSETAAEATPESGAAVNDGGDGGEGDAIEAGDEAVVTATGEEEHEEVLVPFFRPPTADLNMTFALSILAFTAIQIAGISAHGVVGRIKHMADPPFLFPIELIGEFSRILSLAARLFGNVFAGEILLGVMYSMAAAIKIAIIPVLFPVLFIGLEVLFGTIQALVFALLTLIYIMLAAAHSEHDGGDHEPAHDGGSRETAPATQPSGD
ncbi:MAG: F0F1 ATP synthase subunit A [Thermomicrobiales bacterium]